MVGSPFLLRYVYCSLPNFEYLPEIPGGMYGAQFMGVSFTLEGWDYIYIIYIYMERERNDTRTHYNTRSSTFSIEFGQTMEMKVPSLGVTK